MQSDKDNWVANSLRAVSNFFHLLQYTVNKCTNPDYFKKSACQIVSSVF